MKKFICSFTALFFFLTFIVFGCGNSDIEKARLDLNEANEKIKNVELENERIKKDVDRLQRTVQRLLLEKKIILDEQKEFKEWSKKLVEGYGPGIWYIDESTLPIFVESIGSGGVDEIIKKLNRRFEKKGLPRIVLKKIDKNKVYAEVSDQELLTQRMGSHGALSYLNSVTYSITSVKGIDCVWFDFKEGDHAIPGQHCK